MRIGTDLTIQLGYRNRLPLGVEALTTTLEDNQQVGIIDVRERIAMTGQSLRVVLTGGTGYLGQNLVRKLCATGSSICLVSRCGSDLDPFISDQLQRVDASLDASAMSEQISSFAPHIAVHLATFFVAEHCPENIPEIIESNISFPSRFAEALVLANVNKFLNVSTAWQHYNNELYNPANLYSATKQAFEDVLRYFYEVRNLSVLTLVLNDTYGPRDRRPKLFAALAKAAQSLVSVPFSPGEQALDLTYVDDAIDALLIGIGRLRSSTEKSFERFAVRPDNPVKLREIAAIYSKISKTKLNIAWGERPYRTREFMYPPKTNSILPEWHPSTTLKEGIRKLVEADV